MLFPSKDRAKNHALVSFLARPKPRISFLGLSLLRNSTETLATQASLGTVLGPLLFLIHTNDISGGSKIISSVLFADDTKVFYSHKSADILCNTMNREPV